MRREGAVKVRVAANGVAFGENEITVKLVPQPEVFSVQPSVGPVGGGARIRILGRGLVGNTTFCKFGDIEVRASLLSMEELMCLQPSLEQGSYALEVVIDGIASANGAKYHAVAYTTLELVSKPHISVRGGSRLRFTTQEPLPPARPDAYACRVGTRTVAASVDPVNAVSCVAPAGSWVRTLFVARGRGMGQSDPAYVVPTLSLLPTSGPAKRRVVVSGERLGGAVRCRFGAMWKMLSAASLGCVRSSSDTGSVKALSIDSEPWFDVGFMNMKLLAERPVATLFRERRRRPARRPRVV